ncbi:unnamed protein product [Vitrella brassicaformis CCMP3155]|uniref:phospholipase D n=1 Tax=Vitrella brassicaformis (strain CCMP3155) TaxID=1169540 RepID=A0A0G4EDA0_VITBC|nr:unnamed protein product [Vitrella brassicaformis CCMP3155]|eukprot:CEL93534.1 unnamed protein product [Vitrella brassicaformis CCMP3155]
MNLLCLLYSFALLSVTATGGNTSAVQSDRLSAIHAHTAGTAGAARGSADWKGTFPERKCTFHPIVCSNSFDKRHLGYYEQLYEILTDPNLGKGSEIIFTGYKIDVSTRLLGAWVSADNPPLSFLFKKLIEKNVKIHVVFWQNIGTFTLDAVTTTAYNVNEQAKQLDRMGVRVFIDVGTEYGTAKMANSNHMKSLVINREVAFIGGLDIDPERVDSPEHRHDNPSRYAPKKPGNLQKPWQDIHSRLTGQAAKDIAYIHEGCKIYKSDSSSWLGGLLSGAVAIFRDIVDDDLAAIRDKMCTGSYMPPWDYEAPRFDFTPYLEKHKGFPGTCQILLSGTRNFLKTPESITVTSIMDDYVRLIGNAERYVYLETQYFVGLAADVDCKAALQSEDGNFHPRNAVPAAIFERITKAMDNKEDFSFVLSVPLAPYPTLPLYAVLMSLFHERCGMVSQLERYRSKHNVREPLKRYFSVYFHGRVANLASARGAVAYATYVHSKMLIVDDRYCHLREVLIMCNDRSMTGEGDAEANVRFTAGSAKPDTNGVVELRKKVFGYLFPYLTFDPFSTYKRSFSEMVSDAVDEAGEEVAQQTGLDWAHGTLQGKPLRELPNWEKITGGFNYIDLGHTIDDSALPLLWPLTKDIFGEPRSWRGTSNATSLAYLAW